MTSLLQDVRYALRMMRRNAGVTWVALFSLAISLGPAAAMFSVIDAIGFRPLAIGDPEHLIRLYSGDATDPRGETSYADYVEIPARARQLADAAAWRSNAVGVTGGDRAADISLITTVSDTFFPLRCSRARQPTADACACSRSGTCSPSDRSRPRWCSWPSRACWCAASSTAATSTSAS